MRHDPRVEQLRPRVDTERRRVEEKRCELIGLLACACGAHGRSVIVAAGLPDLRLLNGMLFFEFSLACLSRACHGKMMIIATTLYKVDKNRNVIMLTSLL